MTTPTAHVVVDRVRQLLSSAAGLRFDDSRRDQLLRIIQDRSRALGLPDAQAYPDRLAADPDELAALLSEVTVPETHFFRNPPQMQALREHVLPQLAARALQEDRPLRIWSAGCATGEEPYTLAVLVREVMARLPGGHALTAEVVGTDISRTALAAAERAGFGARSVALVDDEQRTRWFTADGAVLRPVPAVTDMVRLARHNLATDPPPFPPGTAVDLVLCRNVTIYLDRVVTSALMRRLHAVLADGGYLFLGHSETLWQVNDQFRLVTLGDAFVYRRDPAGPAPSRPIRRDRQRPTPVPGTAAATGAVAGEAREEVLAQAWAALSDGHPEQALSVADAVASASPMLAGSHHLRGLALTRLQRPTQALVALRAAAYADPDDGLIHLALAAVQQQLGHTRAARVSWRNAADRLLSRPPSADHPAAGGQGVDELVRHCRDRAAGAAVSAGRGMVAPSDGACGRRVLVRS